MVKRTFFIKEKIHRFIFSDVFFLTVLCLFIFINWLLMIRQDILACNDYYHYFFAQEKLFSGNLNLEFIPPLFPFLLGLFGRFIRLFGGSTDHFILGGQIISLLSGFGVLIVSYKLLKKLTPTFSIFGTIFISISPFFLKLLSTAQTDMLYLFFVISLFYFLTFNREAVANPQTLKNKRKILPGVPGRQRQKKILHAVGFMTAGLLTRFEGVLLIGSCLLNYFDLKKKNWKYLLLSSIPAGLLLYFLFDRFAHRLIDKVVLIVSKGYYLYYFTHPGELVHLLYGNFLYFVPHKIPPIIDWFLFFILVGLFFVGIYSLFKNKKRWLLSTTFYIVLFILAKGYTQALQPEMEFRRWLSIIWLFFVISLTGTQYLWRRLKGLKQVKISVKFAFALFCVLVVMFLPIIKGTAIYLSLFLLPLLLNGVTKMAKKKWKWEFAGWFLIFAIFFSQVYYDGLKRTFFYLSMDSNAGSFMVAKWINTRPADEKILVYAYWPMFRYYVDKEKIRGAVVIKDQKIFHERGKLLDRFKKILKKQKIKYIAFDGYRSPTYKARNAIKDLLYQERDKGNHFEVKKHLYYKGKYTASVLMPKQ